MSDNPACGGPQPVTSARPVAELAPRFAVGLGLVCIGLHATLLLSASVARCA